VNGQIPSRTSPSEKLLGPNRSSMLTIHLLHVASYDPKKGYGPARWRRTFQNSPRILRRHRQHARFEVNVALTPICVTVGPACYRTPCFIMRQSRASATAHRLHGPHGRAAHCGPHRRAGHPRADPPPQTPDGAALGGCCSPKVPVPALPRHRGRDRSQQSSMWPALNHVFR
jgi:hypothetical protein